MKRFLYVAVPLSVLAIALESEVLGQRGGGGRGGGGGGGRAAGAGGGGGRSNPTPSLNRPSGGGGGGGERPSFNAPSARPGIGPGAGGGGGNRPGGGGGGINRPGGGGGVTRPGGGGSGLNPPGAGGGNRGGGNRPGGGTNRPGGPSTLPARPDRPNLGGGTIRPGGPTTLPARPDRPGTGGGGVNPPGPGAGTNRPGGPSTLPARPDRPGLGGGTNRPGGPTTLPAATDRPINSNRPIDSGNVNRPDVNIGNRQISNQFNYANWNHYNRNWAGAYHPAWARPGNWYRPWYAGRPVWNWGRPWYWNHWHWHTGYWNYWRTLPAFWMGLSAGALLSPGDTIVYSNPYYAPPSETTVEVPVTINYSNPISPPAADQVDEAYPPAPDQEEISDEEPLPTTDPPTPQTDDPAVNTANEQFDVARKAFKSGDYAKAQELVERAIQALPSDATLHEFRALTMFAQKKYKEAAAALYAVLSAGPGWDKDTMATIYPDWNSYTPQLRALEEYVQRNPKEADGRFLLAYQYLVLGYKDQAVAQFRDVVRLEPKDQLSAALLKALTQPDARMEN